jgi:predicted transcriptional regulator
MSSEPKRQPSPQPGPRPRPRQAEGQGAGRPDQARDSAQGEDEPLKLTDAKAMRAVAHPVRMALIELFSYHETLTATQASELLGESPANCAFHLRTLAKYGFVREAGGGKGRERPWTLVNRSVTITTNQPDPQAAVAADELGRLWLERWIDRARRSYGLRNQVPGWDEASGWSSRYVFMTAEEATGLRDEMRRLLNAYEDRLTDPALRPEGSLPVEWTVFAAPVQSELPDPRPATWPDDPDANGPSGADAADPH